MYRLADIENKILHGDSLRILKEIPDGSVDLIFADPPYWMQTDGVLLRTNGSKFEGVQDDWDKFNSFADYDAFTFEWLAECKRVLKKDGSMWVIGSFQNIFRVGKILQDLGFWILNDVIWEKPNAAPNFSGTRFQNAHETLIWCSKNKGSKYQFNYKTMKSLNGGRQDRSIWQIGICIGKERLRNEDGKKVHATQKPERLLYKVILSSTAPGDLVLDPFFGTGTTGAVAKSIGRRFIGIERDSAYIEAASKRIEKVKDVSDDISNLKLEVKPPRVSMLQLIQSGMLVVDESLFDPDGNKICAVCKNGKVWDGEEELSIHKMAAKVLSRTNYNGWSYFYVRRSEANKLVSIDELRYKYANNEDRQ